MLRAKQGADLSGKVAAFASYGVVLRNVQWSWSGITPSGEVVVTLWIDEFNYRDTPATYSNQNSRDFQEWVSSLGNLERIENLKIARDKHAGIFRVIVIKAVSETTYPRTIAEAYPRHNIIMRLVEFDENTGKFKAELVENAHRT